MRLSVPRSAEQLHAWWWRRVARSLDRRGRLTDALVALVPCAPDADARLRSAFEGYLNRAEGIGNDNPATNGEEWLMARVLPTCDVVFDVGANRGRWAEAALRVNPALRLHCFEPSTGTFQALKRQLPESVRVNNVGLSSRAAEASLYVFDTSDALNSLYQRRGLEDGWGIATPVQQEPVTLVPLDGYCAEQRIDRVDYLKLDVEGHELDVLNGAAEMFTAGRIKYGQFEYGGCNIDARTLLRDFFEWFGAMQYDLFKLFPDRLVRVPRYDQRLENFRYQNWVFARRDLPVPE